MIMNLIKGRKIAKMFFSFLKDRQKNNDMKEYRNEK